VVEVVSGAALLGGPAEASAELRVPNLYLVVLSAFLLLINVAAGTPTIVRLVMLLLGAMLRQSGTSW